jgi:16S rRNA C967 or C1407 C5-methylase (RsmB/RsmF family)
MYLPPSGLARVSVSHRDGGLFFKNYHDTFDAVLVDAPCSGERYLLEKPGGEEEWRPKRSQRLASRQMALLCSALHVLKDNGCLVYSTCSISPIENDQLVQRFLRKRKDQVVMTKSHFILPTPQKNIGPIYFASFRKSQHKNKLETALR